jgi:hypothetical protein
MPTAYVALLVAWFVGATVVSMCASTLLITWSYHLLRISGHFSASAEKDAKMQKLNALFLKLLPFAIVYTIVISMVVIHVVGFPH